MQNRIRDNRLVFYVVGGIVLTALLITIYMHIWLLINLYESKHIQDLQIDLLDCHMYWNSIC
jgi:hypothetical protein